MKCRIVRNEMSNHIIISNLYDNKIEINDECIDKSIIMAFPLNTFDFITNDSHRIMYETALRAITELELWNFMKQHSGSFMFSNLPEITQIYNKIEEFGYFGHSGSSFALTMQTMKYIADFGLDTFHKDYIKSL